LVEERNRHDAVCGEPLSRDDVEVSWHVRCGFEHGKIEDRRRRLGNDVAVNGQTVLPIRSSSVELFTA